MLLSSTEYIFSYIHRLGSFLGVQNFEFHFFGGGGGAGFRKMNIFGLLRFCVYFLGVITKLGYI